MNSSRQQARRIAFAIVVCIVGYLALPGGGLLSLLRAQNPPAPAPAPAGAPAHAPAPAAGGAATEEGGEAVQPQNFFVWVAYSSGLIGVFILLLSFYFVATVVQLFIEFRQDIAAPPHIVQECENLLGQREYQGMYDLLMSDDSYFSTILMAGIAELRVGLSEARDATERQADALTVEMEKKASILAVLGTLGPMIGLLGTLKGMITSFSVIARSGVTLKANEVAGGISEALLLTFEGVALSVPAIYFFAFFRNRISTISVNTQLLADGFLRRMGRMSKTKTPGQTTAASV